MNIAQVRQRIREALEDSVFQGNISALTRALTAKGYTFDRSAVSRMIGGGRDIKIQEIDAIASILGVSSQWLQYGTHDDETNVVELRRISLDEEHQEDEAYLSQRQLGFSSATGYEPSIEGGIPEIDVLAGAGNGAIGEVVTLPLGDSTVAAHQVVDEWKFPEGYLGQVLNVSAGRSLILPVIGDSMIPTYTPGDRVLVDLRQNEMTIDAVYVISDGESPPQIKRLQRVLFSQPAMVEVISDNPSHKPQQVELAHLTIVGRVAGKVSKQ